MKKSIKTLIFGFASVIITFIGIISAMYLSSQHNKPVYESHASSSNINDIKTFNIDSILVNFPAYGHAVIEIIKADHDSIVIPEKYRNDIIAKVENNTLEFSVPTDYDKYFNPTIQIFISTLPSRMKAIGTGNIIINGFSNQFFNLYAEDCEFEIKDSSIKHFELTTGIDSHYGITQFSMNENSQVDFLTIFSRDSFIFSPECQINTLTFNTNVNDSRPRKVDALSIDTSILKFLCPRPTVNLRPAPDWSISICYNENMILHRAASIN